MGMSSHTAAFDLESYYALQSLEILLLSDNKVNIFETSAWEDCAVDLCYNLAGLANVRLTQERLGQFGYSATSTDAASSIKCCNLLHAMLEHGLPSAYRPRGLSLL